MLSALAISPIALGVPDRDGLLVLIVPMIVLVSIFIMMDGMYALIRSTIFLLGIAVGDPA